MSEAAADAVAGFIERWRASGDAERANYVMFLTDLCALLELPQPEPARDDGSTRETLVAAGLLWTRMA